ncbi:MAG: type II secretion system protein [Candidatus Saccharibacteria bacterium]|nr:type II secretion system protein [Candidatus Saccharibacteria bacterium]
MNKRNGFTIIEVVLVLGIAGLIFAMTFVALPALWKSQRDAERENDITTFVQDLKSFQTDNNRGALPSSSNDKDILDDDGEEIFVTWEAISTGTIDSGWADFYENYLGEGFVDPNGENYELVITNCAERLSDLNPGESCDADILNDLRDSSFAENEHRLYVVIGAVCGDEEAISAANNRRVAVLYRLEAAGVYCQNT